MGAPLFNAAGTQRVAPWINSRVAVKGTSVPRITRVARREPATNDPRGSNPGVHA
jgi:hypothetical protein